MTTAMPGRPIWIELYTSDTDAAVTFYGGLFGWEADIGSPEYGGYVTFRMGGEPVAGCMFNDGRTGAPDSWSVYLESDDAAATAAMAEANGGQVAVEPMQVSTMGHMAFIADPAGAMVGIWQPGEHPGFTVTGEPGTPGWFEVLSKDYDAVVPFYENVFGWVTHTMSDTPQFRYTTLGRDEHALAGIMDAAADLGDGPSAWQFYVMSADTDATVARALDLGGGEVVAAQDTPYGRLASLLDPGGVPFHVMGPNLASGDAP